MRWNISLQRWTVWSATVALTLGGLMLASCGDDDLGSVPAGSPPGVFSWDTDDLDEWVTEDEMSSAVADVLTVNTSEALDGGAVDHLAGDTDWTWEFRLPGETEVWSVIAHDGDHGGRYEGPPIETDPRLPAGVTYDAGVGFAHGFYIFSGPRSDGSICMALFPPGTSFGYPAGGAPEEAHADRVFSLASAILHELGWVE